MNSTDLLFHNFLSYASKWKAGEKPDHKQYFTQTKYFSLWDHFLGLFLDGICPTAVQASLESEKYRLLNRGLEEDEILEVVLLEKLLYSFYIGDYFAIAELAQHFTSQRLQDQYAPLLDEFSKKDYEIDDRYSSQEANLFMQSGLLAENAKESVLKQCFLDIRMVVSTFLELKKISLICQMLKDNISREAIQRYTYVDDTYLDIVGRFIDENSGIIYHELIQNGCVAGVQDDHIDYDHLDFNESQIMQILKHYFKV